MPALQEKVCLIVPCYNEEKRLDLGRFESFGYIHYLFVNDGSTDGTARLLAANVREPHYWLDLPANCGKAEAVRRGMLHARELPIWDALAWVGFWDADLATPVEEVEYLLLNLQFYGHVDAVFGSRVDRLGSTIARDYFRHLLGRFFATVVQILFQTGSYDTQCGAKLFRKEVLEEAFGEPFTSRWLFDIEILLRLAGRRVIECPLRRWQEIGGSKIRFFSFSVHAARDLYLMHRRYGRRQSAPGRG